MAEDVEDDKTSRDELTQISDRLKYLESIARETVSRLYLIETKLGLAHRDPWVKPEGSKPQQTQTVEPQAPPPPRPTPPAAEIKPPVISAPPPPPPDQESARPSPPPEVKPREAELERGTPPPAKPASPSLEVKPLEPARPPRPPAQRPLDSGSSVLGIEPPRGAAPQISSVTSRAGARTSTARKAGLDLESRIGGNWFNRIGVVAIILGVGFFFKYAYDNGWIKPWGWVSIGMALGVAFLVGGEKTRKKYESYAYGLTGCGISLLYVSVFAAFRLFELVPQPVAFATMALVTATASVLSARYNALAIAVLGLIGGFLTPILLSTGHDNEPALFGYITVLDLGVLALAYSKQWRSLNYLSFVATVSMFIAWADEYYGPDKLWTTVLFLTVFFVIFALLAVLYNVVNRRPTTWLDLGLVFINALLYFGTTYELLEEKYHHMLGAVAIVVAAFYMGLGYFTYRRDREDSLLIHTFLGLAFLFSVLAVPIQFDQHWVTMAWAVEGAVMTWVGLRTQDRTSRYAGLIVFAIAATHWLRVDVHDFAFQAGLRFTPVLNPRGLSCAVLVGALAAAARLYHIYREKVDEQERSMLASLYILAANAAAILLLSLDANDYFIRSREVGGWPSPEHWNNSRQFTLSTIWTMYAVVTLVVGITRSQKLLRVIALVLLSLATLKVLAIDLPYFNAEWHITLINETFASLMMLVFGLAVSAWFYSRAKVEADERRMVMPALIVAANILALIALTTEPIGYFSRETLAAQRASALAQDLLQLKEWMHFTLTAIWTIYAASAYAIGFRRRSKPVRMGALLLLGFGVAKLLLVDAGNYDAAWHKLVVNQTFGAFALLIAAISLVTYLYSRAGATLEGERLKVVPVLVSVVNLLAVIGLSLEAIGYFARAIHLAHGGPATEIESRRNSMQLTLTAIWAVYAAIALTFAFRRNSKLLRIGALLLLGLGTLKVLLTDARFYSETWHTLILNQTFVSFALLIAALALASYFYSRSEDASVPERDVVAPMVAGVANLLALLALSLEAIGYFKRQIHWAPSDDVMRLENSMHFALTAIWASYAAAAVVIGVRRKSDGVRIGALLLLGLATAKVLIFDAGFYDESWHRLVFNPTFGAFALVVAAMSLAVLCYARSDEVGSSERGVVVPILITAANIVSIIALSAEAYGHYSGLLTKDGLAQVDIENLHLARNLSLSVIWTVYGGGMLMAGIWRRRFLLRVMALVLLSVTILKVFLRDLAALDKIYRIISFIVLGLILLAVSYLYQRYRQRTADPAGETLKTPGN